MLFVVYWSGFLLTFWANSTGRFRFTPYGLPRSMSAALKQSIVDTGLTFFWFVSVPLWFIVRRTKRRKQMHDQL